MTDQGREAQDQGTRARPGWRRFLPLGLLALALVAIVASGLHRYLTLEAFIGRREQLAGWVEAHHFLALLIFVVAYTMAVAVSVPGASLLTVAGGFLFGGLIGGTAAVVAATLGATLLFMAAGTSFGAMLQARAGGFLARLQKGFEQDAAAYMLFLRLVPAFPFWAVNLAPALLGVRLWTFVWTTFVGIIPGTFAFAFAGAGIDSVALAQKQAYESCLASGAQGCTMHLYLHQLVTPQLIVACVALGVVALIPVLLRRWRTAKAR